MGKKLLRKIFYEEPRRRLNLEPHFYHYHWISLSVMSNSLLPHGLQHARHPCPTPTPGTCSNSCPSSPVMPSTHLTLSNPLLLLHSVFPRIRVFSNESVLRISWPKYWSFNLSIRSSNEYSGLISFRKDWLDLLAVSRDSQESSPTPQFKSINYNSKLHLNKQNQFLTSSKLSINCILLLMFFWPCTLLCLFVCGCTGSSLLHADFV